MVLRPKRKAEIYNLFEKYKKIVIAIKLPNTPTGPAGTSVEWRKVPHLKS